MTDAQQKEFLKKYETEVISPEEAAKRTRGASNSGYYYLNPREVSLSMTVKF